MTLASNLGFQCVNSFVLYLTACLAVGCVLVLQLAVIFTTENLLAPDSSRFQNGFALPQLAPELTWKIFLFQTAPATSRSSQSTPASSSML